MIDASRGTREPKKAAAELRESLREAEGRLAGGLPPAAGGFARRLLAAYREGLRRSARGMLEILDRAPAAGALSGDSLELVLKKAGELQGRIRRDSEGYLARLKCASSFPAARRASGSPAPVRPVGPAHPLFFDPSQKPPDGLRALEIMRFDSREAREGYLLLARWFAPDEIDGPEMLGPPGAPGSRERPDARGPARASKRMWHRWLMTVLCDDRGRVVSAADGAVIAAAETTCFYFSHIATRADCRSAGLGAFLSGALLQAAEDRLGEAVEFLSAPSWSRRRSGEPLLAREVCEVEFPDFSPLGGATLKRLPFHGKAGRSALWPFRYAQPDTDYRRARFDSRLWNSVPMFLCYRAFHAEARGVRAALEAAFLLMDYFAAGGGKAGSEGVEWDRAEMERGLSSDAKARLVPLPKSREEIESFVAATGRLQDLLPRYYPKHRYTKDRKLSLAGEASDEALLP